MRESAPRLTLDEAACKMSRVPRSFAPSLRPSLVQPDGCPRSMFWLLARRKEKRSGLSWCRLDTDRSTDPFTERSADRYVDRSAEGSTVRR